jgi:uncharacterized membrane protein
MRAPNISWGAAPETILNIYPLLANHYTSQTAVWCLVLGGRCLLLLLPWWLTQFLLILILPLDSSAAITPTTTTVLSISSNPAPLPFPFSLPILRNDVLNQ